MPKGASWTEAEKAELLEFLKVCRRPKEAALAYKAANPDGRTAAAVLNKATRLAIRGRTCYVPFQSTGKP